MKKGKNNARALTALLVGASLVLCLGACSRVDDIPVQTDSSEQYVYIGKESSATETSIPPEESNYALSFLTDEEKLHYDELLAAVNDFRPQADFSAPLDSGEMKKLFVLLYNQESGIFWLDSLFCTPEETCAALKLTYRFEKNTAETMRAELDLTASTLLGTLPADADDYEKIKAFHDYIVLNCNFTKDSPYSNTAYGAIVAGEAQCEGYAFALSYLCDKAGIENYIVTGTNSLGATHAWNKILADGEWYNVDCTWDDPILKHENPDFLMHDYFLVPDSLINGITHFPDTSIIPSVQSGSQELNFFIREGLVFDSAQDGIDALEEQILGAVRKNKHETEIRFSDKEAYDEAYDRLFTGKEINSIISSLNGRYGLKIKSAYKYDNDELCIIHISLVISE